FWKAGVDKKALQFAPCSGATVGQKLVSHVDVDSVILTGGTETALTMLQHQPNMHLLAETGGKDATIVTSMSDHDQAIKHLLQSAFGHSGQKCSATSLLILEEDLFYDKKFKQTLCDAVKSLTIGSAWDLSTRIGPLIKPPEGSLETALKELEPGESWAVLPRQINGNPQLYSPAIKWNVQPGSFTHMTEFFGPVLGVMKAKNLEEAVELVNQTGFGLTSGLESLDDREQKFWKENIRAGNLYINRVTTGAIVLRQPFGGMGKSIFGPGIKAGGPNYVAQLMTFKETTPLDEKSSRDAIQHSLLRSLCQQLSQQESSFSEMTDHEIRRIESAIISYEEAMQTEFSIEHDHFKLVGEDNIRRYLPVAVVRVRVHPDDSFFEIVARIVAAHVVGCRVVVSQPLEWESSIIALLDRLTDPWAGAIEFIEESDEELATVLLDKLPGRIRFSSPERVPDCIRSAVAQTGMCIVDTPVSGHGRIELLWYMREQSISFDYHRYGNLGQRAKEKRGKVL
ncbi:Proline dehydrogenase / Delta-1-pyrroline-5-carboxylate dehydrogenase, partial [hydrothermal vent metagenome]